MHTFLLHYNIWIPSLTEASRLALTGAPTQCAHTIYMRTAASLALTGAPTQKTNAFIYTLTAASLALTGATTRKYFTTPYYDPSIFIHYNIELHNKHGTVIMRGEHAMRMP